jgi:VanZ family protein
MISMTRLYAFWRPSAGVWLWSFWSLVLTTLWLSLVPGGQMPQGLHFWDKAQHAAGFAGLSFLGLMAYPGRIYALMLGLALFGAGTEVAQWLTGWRFGDWQDWVADCVGLVMGAVAWRLMRWAAPR